MKEILDYKIIYYASSKLNPYEYINLDFAEDKDIYVRFEDGELAPSLSFTYYFSFFSFFYFDSSLFFSYFGI